MQCAASSHLPFSHSTPTIPHQQPRPRSTLITAAAAGGTKVGNCDRRQALQVTGAWALGASALLSGPRPAPAAEEAGAAAAAAGAAAAGAAAAEGGFIFPNVSEPAFGTVCFLEFAEAGTNGKRFGRVEVSLYDGVAPKTVENFKALCAGSGSNGASYRGSSVYRVLKVRDARVCEQCLV